MINRFTQISLLLLIGILYSCEEPLELIPNKQSRLVIFSTFSDQKELRVAVSKTKSYLTQDPADYVTNATVMVFAGPKLLEVLDFVPYDAIHKTTPYYKSNKIKPVTDEVYTIKVSAPGFHPVSATNSIPKAIPIEMMEFNHVVTENQNKESVVQFDVSVTINDPSNAQNFYHLFFYQELAPFSISPEGDTLIENVQLIAPIAASPSSPNYPLVSHYDKKSFLLKDNTFNGQKITMSFNGSYVFNKSKYIPGNFFVELRSVSEAYFLYHSTLTRQVNSTHPLSEGVVIYHNIENGEGIFAGFSSAFNFIKLQT